MPHPLTAIYFTVACSAVKSALILTVLPGRTTCILNMFSAGVSICSISPAMLSCTTSSPALAGFSRAVNAWIVCTDDVSIRDGQD